MAGRSSSLSTIQEARRMLGPQIVRGLDLQVISVYEFQPYRAERMLAPPRDHHVVTICLDNSPHVRQVRAGMEKSGPALAGRATVMPAGHESLWDGQIPRHLRIAIPTAAMEQAADAVGLRRSDRPSLRNEMQVQDPFISEVSAILRRELELAPHPGQQLVIDSLAAAITAHVLRTYGPGAELVGLPPSRPRRAGIRRALEYVAAQPPGPISLDELAAAAGLSKYHFARAFRDEMGVSPSRYVESLRIEHAKRLLAEGELSVAQVAVAVGFSDQSHFARRFRAGTGRPPSAFLPIRTIRTNERKSRPARIDRI